MASTLKIYRFTYENGGSFKLEQSLAGASYTSIIDMTENGDIGRLFDKGLSASLKSFFGDLIDGIVTDMKG